MKKASFIGYTKKVNWLFKMKSLKAAAETIAKTCLAIKKDEKVLILIDKRKKDIGKILFDEIKNISQKVDLVEMPIGKINGEEPPKKIAKKMLDYDVEILATTKSLTHTKARKQATKKGARIATMPNIQKGTMKRTIAIDYNKQHKLNNLVADILDKGNWVKVTTKQGTCITFSIKGRNAKGRHDELLTKKGAYGNLPCGEVFVAPLEKSANGLVNVNGSIGGIGKVDKTTILKFEKGILKQISATKVGKKLAKTLDLFDKKARNIAEFGIGTNKTAKITGNVLEDEKVYGTAHIAIGNNTGFGGKNEVPLHIDCVFKNPTIIIDKKKIMNNGKLL